jgi:nucleotide-binding universal stress UspA family protein
MYEIVAGIDQDEDRALAQAEAITDLPSDNDEIAVTVIHGFEQNEAGASVSQIASVRKAKEYLEDAGVDVFLSEASGDPANQIVQLADEMDADMVCVAGRKRTPTGKVLFGSVTQGVILNTDRPVLVCSQTKERPAGE